MAPLDIGREGRDSERLSFSSILGASVGSVSRGSRVWDPIPLTPKILHLLDRLQPYKGKHAKMLTAHLTRQRLLPATEQELQAQLEKRTHKEIRKQQAAANTTANRAAEIAEMEKTLHTDAMLQQITDKSRNAALAAGAIEEEAHATIAKALAMAKAKHQDPMQT
jgi:hypothetical protein